MVNDAIDPALDGSSGDRQGEGSPLPDTGHDTIFAISTPPGRSGVAVIRISGPSARDCFPNFGVAVPQARRAALATLKDSRDGLPIDQALCLFFPSPNSFTGEDVVELHVHGSMAVLEKLMSRLSEVSGFRMAEPGEFSRRAFDHGKLDLIEAEGLIDLIEAETEAQRRQALRQMQGALSDLYTGWMDRLAGALANIEAALDFSDEDDVPDELLPADREAIAHVAEEMRGHLSDGARGEIIRGGVRVAILGAPNVGKSSLLNALARRDAAIVSDIAGTTRDRIDVHLSLSGIPVTLTDTAGLRETADVVERAGIDRALQASREAHILLLVEDAVSGKCSNVGVGGGTRCLTLWNKADLGPASAVLDQVAANPDALLVSAATGEGLRMLEERLGELAKELVGTEEAPVITRGRHREAVSDSLRATDAALAGHVAVLVAEDLRRAVSALGRVVGKVDVEDLLDRIFGQFCIGK